MNDLPTKEGSNGTTEDANVNPLLATLEAMQRLKAKNAELETRVENLEKAFEMAFKNGAKSLEEFLTKLDTKEDGANEEQEEDESDESETVKGEDEEEEEDS